MNLGKFRLPAIGSSEGRWGPYFVKAAALVLLLFLFGRFASSMPPFVVMLFWIAMSIVSAIGVSYHYVIRKARKRYGLEEGGLSARLNDGRTLCITVSFVISAVCVAGLIMEVPKWELAEWLVLVFAVPVYFAIYLFVSKRAKKEWKSLLRVSRCVEISSALLCVVLFIAYLVICLTSHAPSYESMTEAFMMAKQPYAESPSVLLADLGYLSALVNGLTAFAMSKVAEGSFGVYVVWRALICAGTVIGLSSLIGTCSLKLREAKLVFMPLKAVDDASCTKLKRRYVAVACILPVLLACCCVVVDAKVSEAAQTEEYTAVKAFIRSQVGMAACVIDGKPYDYEKVMELYEKARGESQKLAEEREKALTPLINEAFDKRVENVDAYLDWYYSLPADYERLVQFFSGTIEAGMQDQLYAKINQDVDESAFAEQFDYFMKQSEELETNTKDELAKYELSKYGIGDIPEWLVVPEKIVDSGSDFLEGPLAPTHKFLEDGTRMGLSAGIGAAAGVIATKVASRIGKKAFFKKIVAGLTEKLAVRGLLAEGGTAIAPGIGTVVGIGVGFLGDFLFLKADEAMNRVTYREEIVNAIEESRQEMLDLVRVS